MNQQSTDHFSEQATFAGGCFWCVQGPFDAQDGVAHVQVGYAGGSVQDAVYERVASGATQHRESIHMRFDPSIVHYKTLLELFFRQIDPTDPEGQFADKGFQYTTAVYYHTEEQRAIAQAYIQELTNSGKFSAPIATQVIPFTTFFEAEEEHQSFYAKNPVRYKLYSVGSGRAAYIHRNTKKD